jgi:lysophospholipase L1-like esterase
MPYIQEHFPDNHIDTMALLAARRTTKELSFLQDQSVPELLWIQGKAWDPATWEASTIEFEGAVQRWVGPGYIPLQFRAYFSDGIHLNNAGDALIVDAIEEAVIAKGW